MLTGAAQMMFESAGAAASLLEHFEPDTETWDLPREGGFWEAIDLAHRRGIRGSGRSVAIIDGAFDLSLAPLRRRVRTVGMRADVGEPSTHGTAVALLVAAVAPDAALDLYEVGSGGVPDREATARAISLAASSDADVINLSLGRRQDAGPHLNAFFSQFSDLDQLLAWAIRHRAKRFGADGCDLCAAAGAAHGAGKVVVVAAGNDENAILCPARSERTIACGFQQVRREIIALPGGAAESALTADPTYSQSPDTDFTILQPAGVLGSSFATPLMSGFAALSDEGVGLLDHLAPIRVSALADQLLASAPEGEARPIDALYHEAFRRHPHRHDLQAGEPPCLECGVLCEALYVNAGLFHLMIGDLDVAERRLRTAKWFAPWSADALADLGRTLQERALAADDPARAVLLREALDLYDAALRLRPAFAPYAQQRAVIAQTLGP